MKPNMRQKDNPVNEEKNLAMRASIVFPPSVYQTQEVFAVRKKVSLAWVVCDAAEQYIPEQRPLRRKSAP